jgi:hypothetical protein
LKEVFLHFIWQFQLFNKQDLKLVSGETLNIIKPGNLNEQSGPDFSHAHIRFDELDFYGHVEIHLKSSDWHKHGHSDDPAYDSVILHVVLEDDQPVLNKEGKAIPCVSLRGRIPLNFYNNYERLIQSQDKISCGSQIARVNKVVLISMLDRVLLERLEEKAEKVRETLEELDGDWEEAVFRIILESFGFKRNQDGFRELARQVRFRDIKRHCKDLEDIEALLFGAAGFLRGDRKKDPYFRSLRGRYDAIVNKLPSKPVSTGVLWKFFRLRPANFPTLRIAQLAAFLNQKEHLLSVILELHDKKEVNELFRAGVSDYWNAHYKFSDEKVKGISEIGESSLELLAINAIIPIWIAYGKMRNREELTDRSMRLLEELSPENNKITRFWKEYDFPNNNAFDSQALIQLYNRYCAERKCLKCNVGVTLVREY